MNSEDGVQIVDETVGIPHSTNTLGKGLNPNFLPPAIGKLWGRLGSLDMVWQSNLKENSEFKC